MSRNFSLEAGANLTHLSYHLNEFTVFHILNVNSRKQVQSFAKLMTLYSDSEEVSLKNHVSDFCLNAPIVKNAYLKWIF